MTLSAIRIFKWAEITRTKMNYIEVMKTMMMMLTKLLRSFMTSLNQETRDIDPPLNHNSQISMYLFALKCLIPSFTFS